MRKASLKRHMARVHKDIPSETTIKANAAPPPQIANPISSGV